MDAIPVPNVAKCQDVAPLAYVRYVIPDYWPLLFIPEMTELIDYNLKKAHVHFIVYKTGRYLHSIVCTAT